MYIRFVRPQINCESGRPARIFIAAYYPVAQPETPEWLCALMQEHIDWLKNICALRLGFRRSRSAVSALALLPLLPLRLLAVALKFFDNAAHFIVIKHMRLAQQQHFEILFRQLFYIMGELKSTSQRFTAGNLAVVGH